jgi:preprotein translocase subunit SecA
MYRKLSGMTGTADTEAVEFQQIYGLEVVVAPPNKQMVRKDFPDVILKTQAEKFGAIVEEIKGLHAKGQPVLVGTTSIEKSEYIASLLKKKGVPHEVLNAKYHEKEAEIVAMAGQKGRVTIATNMAGRGTDIVLGEGVRELGGLHILGSERHESRRIDNQLRGRAGRQGDPGSSRFYLALDDTLMRLFGSERIAGIMDKLGLEDGQTIENPLISRSIENAQKRVEGHNFEIRKQLIDYDNVMNQQREVIYSLRREFMIAEDLQPTVEEFVDDLLSQVYEPLENRKGHTESPEEIQGMIRSKLDEVFAMERMAPGGKFMARDEARAAILSVLEEHRALAPDQYQEILRFFLLDALDRNWKDHLLQMDYLKEGIGLRGYAQRDPKQEYKREGFELFEDLIFRIRENTMKALTHLRIEAVKQEELKHEEQEDVKYVGGNEPADKKPDTVRRVDPKVGRNDPCPCGSGQKYKKCCGKLA